VAAAAAPKRAADYPRPASLFGPVTWRRYPWSQKYAAGEYLDLLPTSSDHRLLPPGQRKGLLHELRRAIEMHGGCIEVQYDALLCTYEGHGQESLQALERTLPVLERAPGWIMHYTQVLYRRIEALWVLGPTDHASVLERNLREKTLAPDFRYVHTDVRLALARLCARPYGPLR
jgi:hypothetical protein